MRKAVRIAGRDVLFVMAAQAEYGPHLQRLFTPVMTGVGPVEAGVRLGAELSWLKSEKALPDLVVSLGSAGSRTLEQAEIYQAVSVAYRDIDASPLGFEKGATPFLDLPVTVPLPFRIPDIRQATLSTGAAIISGSAYDAIAQDMVDMETFACLRACQLFGVPLVGLRGISDGAADLRHVGDWKEYLHVIDEKLADAVMRLEQAIGSGALEFGPSHEDAKSD
ncbi:5'-methylthioadenosine/S-adenosylhomocysteine nucleosidase [Mesorhizobium mediterraneum]|uniref:5'-methylthioadenosine/S-adenosylhomocysteine nucleosidase n=1 Tax=Mesorhizobium mediterraneum TaxID=43617 RepID=A0AB36RED4_9HYPH|nr:MULTISPECIES: 5'-methylthioadenosine/S-adenosylhomocysteine nucleosidase [Mesorhizobium]PAQ03311.1 5'-methylthioadenosine/S-adenosylhomocysteine nucleosidase [Mesorhizobium mediterraneum]RUV00365.1 5'-methylthioadenosine/S-adenosylhomocysteine nucleosidase [Mesorhizobium sp. M6A.T.Cr.TU.017.01.1.1]RWN45228.1 MAG: 5'-methylthioadenosine/S-adenosylhomocysteine nucleosidase [Mesorhizobium sp.]RWO97807.1 MAG: 5'-methylthioadenosine/S-adenosylhomocysteine nucleosidase [Mesorhizobium sp.]RWP64225